jgi:hypothetical protein
MIRSRSQGQVTACKSNLKNIGTALEMYATDNHGCYPSALNNIQGPYLKTIPTCPTAGRDTYSERYVRHHVDKPQVDAYTVVCTGEWHAGVNLPRNYPQYTSTQGLVQ